MTVTRTEDKMRYYKIISVVAVGVLVLLIMSVTKLFVFAEHAQTSGAWSTFLGSNARTGYNANETIINPSTAPQLKLHWTAHTSGEMMSQVVIANGMLYWGSNGDGLMHATNPATGSDLWTKNLGTKPNSCSGFPHGLVGSPTVATVPINGVATSVVFVNGGQDNLTALDANTGNIIWQTNFGNDPAEFIYSSTTVYQNSVYVGISSFGDCPLVQGKLVQVNASTGQLKNTFNVVPTGCLGGAVWGTPTIDEATGMIYFGTGNGQSCAAHEPLKSSIVELKVSDLSFVASWPIPRSDVVADDDYGSTPTLFPATINGVQHAMLGLVNKNGYYYALDRTNISAGALWKVRISDGGPEPSKKASIAASTYDGTSLYVAGSATTIQGQSCLGSLQALNPNSGVPHWQICLNGPVVGSLSAVPGLVIVNWSNNMSVVNSATGQTLFQYQDNGLKAWLRGTATISNGVLYDGSKSGNLFAFGL